MAAHLRRPLEQRFGTDFSQVRLHTDETRQRAAVRRGAAAYTYGDDIVAAPGNDLGRSPRGLRSLAHELAHVVQQRRPGPGRVDEQAERGAQQSADAVVTGHGPVVVTGATGPAVACQAVPEFLRDPRLTPSTDRDLIQGVLDAAMLPQAYASALGAARVTGDWRDAAEKLNGFSPTDIDIRLAELSQREVALMHEGATENRRVGPLSNAALMTVASRPRASMAAPTTTAATAPRLDDTEVFRRRVRVVAGERLAGNVRNISAWKRFMDNELSPDQVMAQVLTIEATGLRADAARGGSATSDLYGQWTAERNPVRRELFEHQIHGEWRGCTGCHVSNLAWGLTPQDTRAWQSPTAQLAAVTPGLGAAPAAAPASPQGSTVAPTALDQRMARVLPYLRQLGPEGYRVLPAHEFGADRSPAQLRAAVDRAIDQRVLDYQLLARRIASGAVDYRECRPVVNALLTSASPAVRAVIETELADFDRHNAVVEVLAQVAKVALLLLIVFPPTSAIGIGIGAVGGTTLFVTGGLRMGRGLELERAEGADDVVAPELQREAHGMVLGGALDMISGALAVAGSIAGLRARILSEGRAGALTVTPGQTYVRDELTFTLGADGQSVMVTHRQYPGCFVVVDADGATAFQLVNGEPVRVGSAPWAPPGAAPGGATASTASAAGPAAAPRPPAGLLGPGATPVRAPAVVTPGPAGLSYGPPRLLTPPPASRLVPPFRPGSPGEVLYGETFSMVRGAPPRTPGPLITPPPRVPSLLPERSSSLLPAGDWVLNPGTPRITGVPATSMPFAGRYVWNYQVGAWDLFQPAEVPQLPASLRSYAGTGAGTGAGTSADRGLVLDVPGQVRSLHTDPMTAAGGQVARRYPMVPDALVDPLTGDRLGRSHLDPHFRSRPDEAGLQSTSDPGNYVAHDRRYNEQVRQQLEGRLDRAGSSWQAIEVYTGRTTTGGVPIVSEEIVVQLGPTGQPVRAWRFPTTHGAWAGPLDFNRIFSNAPGGYEIPLSQVPPTLFGARP